jgi:hypothetical protein
VRKTVITGLLAAFIAAFAASAAPAMAHEFVAKQGKGTLQDKSIGEHIITVSGSAIACKGETSKSTVTQAKTTTNKETVLYSGCEAFGDEAKATQAKFGFSAEGKVALENEVIIIVSGLCEIKIPSTGNQSLSKVEYVNLQGRIETTAVLSGLTVNAPSVCGGNSTTSTYKGTSIVEEIQGGKIEWL